MLDVQEENRQLEAAVADLAALQAANQKLLADKKQVAELQRRNQELTSTQQELSKRTAEHDKLTQVGAQLAHGLIVACSMVLVVWCKAVWCCLVLRLCGSTAGQYNWHAPHQCIVTGHCSACGCGHQAVHPTCCT